MGVGVAARGCGEEAVLLRGWGAGEKKSLIFGNLGPYLHISRHADEQGTSHLKLFPGLNTLSHNLRVCFLLSSLEKLETKLCP